MKKLIAILIFLLCAGIVSAAVCTDTDGGENYAEKGEAKYAISGKEDICVISPSAEVRTDTSQYLKEYYCDNQDHMQSDIIDCKREGFEKCEDGKCVGGSQGTSSGNYTPKPPEPNCGNMVVDPGEDCDPMNKICFDDDGNIGLCDADCKCEIKLKSDGSKASDDEEEVVETIVETPVEDDEEPEKEPVVQKEEPKEDKEITVTIAEKPKKEAAPKGFFTKIWAWIKGLFS
jgi:hypothetical protein